MWSVLALAACVALGTALAHTESKVVQVEQGLLRGYRDPQGDFFSFYDVPYAHAPTGRDKFKAPLPPTTWTGTFEATNRMIACPQMLPIPSQEDCLVASIFVPNTNETNLPVVVNVHGGGYSELAGYYFGLSNLAATQKTIVVIFNYRLNMFGFLCLGTEQVPGNAGMKDQVALLRWVNKNIAAFGGNPNDVTLSGCSAGGGAVEFLSISPMTKGLFNKVITDSGGFIGITGAQLDPTDNAKRYARHLNFTDVDNLTALEEFYLDASLEFLLTGSDMAANDNLGNSLLFSPCVERETGEEIFLPDTPINILKNGNYEKVPMIYGFSEMEGLYRINDFNHLKDMMNSNNFSIFVPDELQFDSIAQKEEVGRQIKEFYFGSAGVTEQNILDYVNYFTDVPLAYTMMRAANLRRSSHGDTIYLYQYSFVDENSPLVPHTDVRGSGHCAQLIAVTDEDVTNATDEYITMKQTMRQMWIDFILTGNPTPAGSVLPSWPPISGYLTPHMIINSTSSVVHSPLLEERVRFWDSIYDKHYRQPIPPSNAAATSISIA